MKKKLWAIFLVGMMALSMTACGDKAAKEETKTEQAAEASAEAAPAEEEADAAETTEEGAGEASLKDLEAQIAEAYMGVTEAGEGFYYAGNKDGTFAIVLVADPSTKETASFVGKCEKVSDNQVTITDDASGNTLTFGVTPNEDGTLLLDLGDLGSAAIAKCEASVVLDAMQTINDNGIPVM